MLRIKSTVYPPGRIQNVVKEGGLWYCEKQNELINSAKKIIDRKPKRDQALKKIIIAAILLDVFALITIICRS